MVVTDAQNVTFCHYLSHFDGVIQNFSSAFDYCLSWLM